MERAFSGQVKTGMRPGSGGIFDVFLNGQLVFSKHQAGRFPTEDEVLDGIEERMKGR